MDEHFLCHCILDRNTIPFTVIGIKNIRRKFIDEIKSLVIITFCMKQKENTHLFKFPLELYEFSSFLKSPSKLVIIPRRLLELEVHG